jgi:hypothetical protein
VRTEEESPGAETSIDLATLNEAFLVEANADGKAIHIGRALAMKASYHAKLGQIKDALQSVTNLAEAYDAETHTADMIVEYGRDFAIECFAVSSQWLYLLGMFDEAEKRAEAIMNKNLCLLDPVDVDSMMHVVLPIIQVFSLLERAKDADLILKKYIIQPYQDNQFPSEHWAPLFNPLAYLLEIIIMDEAHERDDTFLEDIGEWVLDEMNSKFDTELERKAHTILGEICWRLLKFKRPDDPNRDALTQKARDLLAPVARYNHDALFQKSAAQALLDSL